MVEETHDSLVPRKVAQEGEHLIFLCMSVAQKLHIFHDPRSEPSPGLLEGYLKRKTSTLFSKIQVSVDR